MVAGRDGARLRSQRRRPAWLDGLAREDLGVAGLLIHAFLYAIGALLLVRLGPPFGAFAVTFIVDAALSATVSGDWRFVPAAIVGGLLVDALVRYPPARLRSTVAAIAFPVALVLAIGGTLIASDSLGRTATLLLGTVTAAAVFGGALAFISRYLVPPSGAPSSS